MVETSLSENLQRRIKLLADEEEPGTTVEAWLAKTRKLGESTLRMDDLPEPMISAFVDLRLDELERTRPKG